MGLAEVHSILDSIRYGEMVLLEYTSPNYVLDFTLLLLKRYADERGLPFIVDDNLDILQVVNEHLKFFGVEGVFDDAIVIKTGGKVEVGRVLRRIPLESEPGIYTRLYSNAAQKAFSSVEKSINAVVGIERLFAFLTTPSDFYTLISSIQGFVGEGRRKAFYFVDRDVAETLKFNPLPELERIASTVIDLSQSPNKGKGTIRKATDLSLIGKELEVSITDLL